MGRGAAHAGRRSSAGPHAELAGAGVRPHRTHLSAAPIEQLYDVAQDPRDRKPRGLWYELDGAWQAWGAYTSWRSYDRLYEVTLGDCRILQLADPIALARFHLQYGQDPPVWDDDCDKDLGPRPERGFGSVEHERFPNWQAVAADYDGVEVSHYLSEMRGLFGWYSMWDVPSGCLWRPGNSRVRLLQMLDCNARGGPSDHDAPLGDGARRGPSRNLQAHSGAASTGTSACRPRPAG